MISIKSCVIFSATLLATTAAAAHAGTFQTKFAGVTGTMEFSSGTGGPSISIPSSCFTDTGGRVSFGSGGSSAGSAVYGTVSYSVIWVPASGETIQQDPPPPTFTLVANVQAAAHTISGVWHPENYAAMYDGFPTDIENNPPYTGNPLDPWYYQYSTGSEYNSPTPLTLWNWQEGDYAPDIPVWATHSFTLPYPSGPISFNFDVALPADADNNTASWDPNPYRHPGAAWPCYASGNNGPQSLATYQIQVSAS